MEDEGVSALADKEKKTTDDWPQVMKEYQVCL